MLYTVQYDFTITQFTLFTVTEIKKRCQGTWRNAFLEVKYRTKVYNVVSVTVQYLIIVRYCKHLHNCRKDIRFTSIDKMKKMFTHL